MPQEIIQLTWDSKGSKDAQKQYTFDIKNAFNALLLGQMNSSDGVIAGFTEKQSGGIYDLIITLRTTKTRTNFITLFGGILHDFPHITLLENVQTKLNS